MIGIHIYIYIYIYIFKKILKLHDGNLIYLNTQLLNRDSLNFAFSHKNDIVFHESVHLEQRR